VIEIHSGVIKIKYNLLTHKKPDVLKGLLQKIPTLVKVLHSQKINTDKKTRNLT
jgi:hypothetical protein